MPLALFVPVIAMPLTAPASTSVLPPTSVDTSEPTTPTVPADEFDRLLAEASTAMQERQQALQSGDWTAYGEADAKLTAAIERLLELEGE